MPRVPGKRPTREGASAGRGWRWSASPAPFPPAGTRVLGSALIDVLVGGLPRFGLATCGDAGRLSVGQPGQQGRQRPVVAVCRGAHHRHWLGPSVPSTVVTTNKGAVPVVWSLAVAPQAYPCRPVGAQRPLVPGQPAGDGPGTRTQEENEASGRCGLSCLGCPWHRAGQEQNLG